MIGAVVLAAGRSTRMGLPKLLLPWGRSTVIGHGVASLALAGITDIVVVTGPHRRAIDDALAGLPARTAHNPCYRDNQMLTTVRVGLSALAPGVQAAVIALGDQPMVPVPAIRAVAAAALRPDVDVALPCFAGRRGHPLAVSRRVWSALIAAPPSASMREVMRSHHARTATVEVPWEAVLWDLDTPADYARHRPAPATELPGPAPSPV